MYQRIWRQSLAAAGRSSHSGSRQNTAMRAAAVCGTEFAAFYPQTVQTAGNLSSMLTKPTAILLLGLALLLAVSSGILQAAENSIGPKAIVELVEHSVLQQLEKAPMAQGALRLEVVAGALDSRLQMTACAHPIRVEADLGREQSRVNAKVGCAAPTPWSIYVPVEIRIYRNVVVAARALQRGDSLGPDDLKIESRDVLAPGSPALTRLDDAIGKSLRRPLAENTVLTASVVEFPILVRRGDRISIRSHSGGISVRANAEALDNGRYGERIRVRNLQSAKVIEVTVTAAGEGET
ncbi:MAG: flagellar basal body P-ring formation protein FlgA [Pseudomonadales bacterium]|nr:flagellar basal body P-ring formation protein FlgA [Pseudomonadales bacterium]